MIQVFKDRIKNIQGIAKRGHWATTIIADSVADLFKNAETLLAGVPEGEDYNLHYKLCTGEKDKRGSFISQNIIPFDIDGIDPTVDPKEYLAPILHVLKVEESEVGIVFSGHGIHIVIETDQIIKDPEYFKASRPQYQLICGMIGAELTKMKLAYKDIDEGPWRANASLRMPQTRNVKEGMPEANCTLHQRIIVPQIGYTLSTIAEIPHAKEKDILGNYEEYVKINPPEVKAVQEGCLFLQHCRSKPALIKELDWYKMLSIVSRLGDNGRDLAHSYSEGHPTYNYDECNLKIDQALLCSGPRTCDNIAETFSKCEECPYRREVKSPITIKSEDYIKTKNTGFYFMDSVPNKEGGYIIKRGKPDYDGLVKYYDQKHFHITTSNRTVMTWKDSHWEEMPDIYLDSFAEEHFNPKPNKTMVQEFVSKVKRTNVRLVDWLHETTFQRVNLKNGVLDLRKGQVKLVPHSKNFGFTSTLQYDYDPTAECPVYTQFMKDITCDRQELVDVLEEFYAYILMNYPCTMAKALFLIGEGMNGKSKWVELMQAMVGKDAYSSVPLSELGNDQKRALLENKLMNISEETPSKALMDSSSFKALVTGNPITVKEVYKKPGNMINRAKFISSCNRLPQTNDDSFGNFRRMLIVPFDATFDGDKEDCFILDKLENEMAGVLNHIISANERLKKRGFTKSEVIKARVEEYKRETSNVINFFDESVTVDRSHELKARDMYNAYKQYCEVSGIHNANIATKYNFCKAVERYYKKRIEKKRVSCGVSYNGLRLTNQGPTDY